MGVIRGLGTGEAVREYAGLCQEGRAERFLRRARRYGVGFVILDHHFRSLRRMRHC